MTFSEFQNIVRSPDQISERQCLNMADICKEHPYFSTAYMLYLKGLYKYNSSDFYNHLGEVAVHSMDRESLFEFIFPKKNYRENIKPALTEIVLEEKSKKKQQTREQPKNKLISLEKRLFTEWLQVTKNKKINRIKGNGDKRKEKINYLIDKFIEGRPHISSKEIKSDKKIIDLAYQGSIDHKSLMTETLARIYLDQKKYDKAEKAYQILSLKYPEKSGFFADKIREIKKHKKS